MAVVKQMKRQSLTDFSKILFFYVPCTLFRNAYEQKEEGGADISIENQSYEVNVPPSRCIC